MNKKKVAIIGTGPSAAFAYQGAKDCNCDITVYGKYSKNFPQGAFWFHWVPAEVVRDSNARRWKISIVHIGTRMDYVKKQWSADYAEETSASFGLNRVEEGFDPGQVWEAMWADAKFDESVGFMDDEVIKALSLKYDYTFHTFPSRLSLSTRTAIPTPTVSFKLNEQPLYRVLRLANPKFSIGDQVIYDGRKDTPTVRISTLFGSVNIEFVSTKDVSEIFPFNVTAGKFMDITPDTQKLQPDEELGPGIYAIGRYAQWDRHMLSHEAFGKVASIING